MNVTQFHDLPPAELAFGRTPAMQAIRQKLESVAGTGVPVLLQGESGTGKEVCARFLHLFSRRTKGSLVKVSCPAIPESLMETELFGYEKGAFTGAHTTKRGRVEEAHNGTLFLDEVGSLDLPAQSKLLQVLQDGSFVRVGGHVTRTIETRLVSCANRDLQSQVEEGSFRLDLLYRINAVTISLPPLRQRREEIAPLIEYFTEMNSRTFKLEPRPLSRATIHLMERYTWPGNIRQLANLVRSYVLIGDEELLAAELVPQSLTAESIVAGIDITQPISLKRITKKATLDLERQIILKVLKSNGWNRQKTAKWLQMSYRSLLYKLNDVEAAELKRTPPPPLAGEEPSTRTVRPSLGPTRRLSDGGHVV
ncbi:MAG TPA: sigma-54 dependent transcriptional regulator [Acidobacteriaceae bacterium]|jgi:two-component system response regulator AtoC|nr:sigma-54 dependent transcriptional regulator [Acidobacteriaceae bacterium]